MALLWLLLVLLLNICSLNAQNELAIAYPSVWDGDKYTDAFCDTNAAIPKWINGYFLCQLSASYGDQSAPPKSKLTYFFDGQGAIAQFHVKDGDVNFTARYYPSRSFKIWDFYNRNMTASKVAWYTVSSEIDKDAISMWDSIKVDNQMSSNPNVDFWRVGHDVIGGTETPAVGYTFGVPKLDNFKMFEFKETSDIFGPNSKFAFINMPIHERMESNGRLWASTAGLDYANSQIFQFLFTVDTNKVRTVVANYSYGQFDKAKCQPDGSYSGEIGVFPGYMHSITSTENYVILPFTSLLLTACKMGKVVDSLQGNMRFLVFDKRTNSWTTPWPIIFPDTLFVTHQMNAYEQNGKLIADMIVYDYNVYSILNIEAMQRPDFPSTRAKFTRFTIDLQSQSVTSKNMLPEDNIDAEFTQFNHNYEGKFYKFTYFVYRPFKLDSAIYKLDVQNSTSKELKIFKGGKNISLGEPWFVQNPGTTGEDDGVLLVRGLNTYARVSNLFVLNATDMSLIGYSTAPTSIPFGLHNRYYSVEDLGIVDPPRSFGYSSNLPQISIVLMAAAILQLF